MAQQPSAPAYPRSTSSRALNPSNPSPSCCFPSAGTTATSLVNASTRIHARRQRRRRGASTTSNNSSNNNSRPSSLLLACLRKSARTTSPGCRPTFSFPALPPMPELPSLPSMPSMPSMPAMPAMPSMPSIPSWPTLNSLDLFIPSVMSGSWGAAARHQQQQQQQRQDGPCPCCPPEETVSSLESAISATTATTSSTTRDTTTWPTPRGRDSRPFPTASGEGHPNPSNWPTDPSRVLAQAYAHVKLKMVEQHQRNWEAISRYCEQVDLWHHDESAFGEHEYDRERVTERSQRSCLQPSHRPKEHRASPSLVAYRMNQHPHEQTGEATQDLPKSRPPARGRVQGRCSMAAGLQSQSKPVFVSVSVQHPCGSKCSSCLHTKEPITVAFGDVRRTQQSFSLPGADMATVSDMDVQSGMNKKKSTSNGPSSRQINGQNKARDRDLRKSMSQSPPSPPSRSTAGEAMLKKDSRFGVAALAEEGGQQQQPQDGHGLEARTQGSNEPGPDSESHMARERNFMISLSCSRRSCFLDKVVDGGNPDGNAPTMALSFSLPSSTSLPLTSLPSSLPVAPDVVLPSLSPTPTTSHFCPPCRPHSPLQPPSSPAKDTSFGNMPVVTLPSVTTRLPIPKQQQGAESTPSPHSLSLSSPTTLQSRADLNRLLDSVLDHATRIAESQSPPTKDCHENTRSRPNYSTTPTVHPPPVSRINSSKVRFFVESDDDDNATDEDEEDYEASLPRSLVSTLSARSHSNAGVCEESGSDDNEDSDYFGKRWQSKSQDIGGNPNPRYEPAAPVRRQSLLSDLFMAEKKLAAQRATSNKHSTTYWSLTSPSSDGSSRCHSAGNSDGESSYSNASPRPQVHTSKYTATATGGASHRPSFSQKRASRGYTENREPLLFPELEQGGEERCKVKSPLTRTKRVFKNLDDLAGQHRVSFLNSDDDDHLIHRSAPFRPRRPTIRPGDARPPRLNDLISKTVTLSSPMAPASVFSIVPASSNDNNHRITHTTPTLTAAETCRCKTPIVTLSPRKLNQVRDSSRLTLPTLTSTTTATGLNRTNRININSNGSHTGVVSLCDSTSGCCVPATVAATTTATSALATSATTTAAAPPSTGPQATAKSAIGGMLRGWEKATQVQGQIQSMYAHMLDTVQRTLSTGSTAV